MLTKEYMDKVDLNPSPETDLNALIEILKVLMLIADVILRATGHKSADSYTKPE
jgi:hypothetical protein